MLAPARELVVDGSFVTAKPAPNDIDLILDASLGLSEPAPAPDAESANALHETQPPYDPLGNSS